MKRKLRSVVRIGVVFAFCGPVMAQWNPSGTQAEQSLLPRFCLVKLKDDNRSPEGQNYIRQFGFDNWLHMHHYCYALNFVNRSQKAANTRDRNSQLQLAVADYNYVLRGTKPDFWMRPQLYVELGRIYGRLDRQDEAMNAFRAAVQANPTYLAGYLALIDQLRKAGETPQARNVAGEGLRHLPDSERLQALYLDLGGKKPFPEPASRKPAIPASPPAESSSEALQVERQQEEAATPERASAPDAASEGAPQDAESGPSCRFCPPEEVQRRWQESFR